MLRSEGLGPLALGMSVEDAVATGFITDPSDDIEFFELEYGCTCGTGYHPDSSPASAPSLT